MDLENLKSNWQAQAIPSTGNWMDKVQVMNQNIEKENKSVIYLFAATVFILGIACFGSAYVMNSYILAFSIMAIMGLLAYQSLIFSNRVLIQPKQLMDSNKDFVDHLKKKLRYNLLVTNWLMPLYMLLLTIIVNVYTYEILSSFELTKTSWIAMAITTLYIWGLFAFVWPKRRKKDQLEIVPLLEEMEGIGENLVG